MKGDYMCLRRLHRPVDTLLKTIPVMAMAAALEYDKIEEMISHQADCSE